MTHYILRHLILASTCLGGTLLDIYLGQIKSSLCSLKERIIPSVPFRNWPLPEHTVWLQIKLTTGEFNESYSPPLNDSSIEIILSRLKCQSPVFIDSENKVIPISKISRSQRECYRVAI